MITFVPVGGLANRIRSIQSAISLSGDDELRIYWFKDQGLNCNFYQLFEPIPLQNVTLKETNLWDKLCFDRPRKKNLYVPLVFQKLHFDACLYENQTKVGYINYKHWKDMHTSVYLASYNQFYTVTTDLNRLFIPIPHIQKKIDDACSSHSAYTIGIHIRRGDHNIAIQKSPINLFITAMENAIDQNPQTNFYLATDSESDKQLLKNKFGNRIITSQQAAERNTTSGIQNAVVDLYALSKTHTIFGSYYSSFSEIAAQLGNNKLHILTI